MSRRALRHHRWTWLLLGLVLWPMACTQKPKRGRSLEGVPVVRVRLLDGQERVTFNASSDATLTVGSETSTVKDGSTVAVARSRGVWRACGRSIDSIAEGAPWRATRRGG